MEKKLYAVYGTLKKGFGNHRILEDNPLVFEGTVNIPFYMVSLGGFPGILKDDKSNSIYIEVYEVSDQETEKRLDRLEGYPSFYNKEIIDTPVGKAYVYFLENSLYGDNDLVESGNWERRSYVY